MTQNERAVGTLTSEAGASPRFQGCPLNVAVRHYPPYAHLTPRAAPSAEGDVYDLHGTFTPLLRALEQGMHAHFNMTPMPDGSGQRGTNLRMTYDIYVSRTLPDPEHRNEVPTTSRGGCYTICVPRRWRRTPLWRALLDEFSAAVWALVAATFVSMRLALTPVLEEEQQQGRERRARARTSDLGFILLAAVLGSVQASTPGYSRANTRDRVLFAMWLFFSLVMTTAYQAVLHGLRTAPQLVDALRDTEELARSDVAINGPAVPQVLLALSTVPGGELMVNRYKAYNFSGITTIRLSRDEAYMCSALERFFLERKLGRDEAGRPHHVPASTCMVSFYEALFALPVGSFYLHKASEVVLRMTETGLTQHVIGRRTGDAVLLMKASDTAPGGPHPENLDQLSPALLLLAVGLGLGAAALALELALASGRLRPPALYSLLLKRAKKKLAGRANM
ncbi:Glutamate receptor 2 [Frankliniella fusca]|uniref:Glutamate receptor 2 n=1 Tax=Frankliniella fusca TaxID=407009 RepID=A0AAE1GS92_9NEOP|nr:Glutamate receptor 2 [Frankliniella fusca]